MASRFGWGKNGGDTLGDVGAALVGKAFGDAPVPAAVYSPNKVVIDCSLGEIFYPTPKAGAAASIMRVGAPINFQEGSEVTLVLRSTSTLSTVVFLTSASTATYALASATFTLVASKTRLVNFKYVNGIGSGAAKFVEVWRSPIAGI